MNYELNAEENKSQISAREAIGSFSKFLRGEKKILIFSGIATLANSGINLFAPLIIAFVIDNYIVTKEFSGVITYGLVLLGLYVVGLVTSYLQTRLMGSMGQRVLYKLRQEIFNKLQALPVAFFDANKTGDLISRINNDTDKLNQFFSQTIVRFIGSVVIMFGAAIFMLVLNFQLALAVLLPAVFLLIFTRIISPWVKRTSAESMKTTGGLSAEVAESINNFKVVVAFNRRDFFRKRFEVENNKNYKASIVAGVASSTFSPVFGFSSNIAQLVVLAYGVYLITAGSLTLGLLVGFLSYATSFYDPLRQIAGLWANLQVALAGWDRISAILEIKSEMSVLENSEADTLAHDNKALLEFKDVSFSYVEGKEVLTNINFTLERGKTYALVGPTGGGKTTTASLMARLYDPNKGTVYFRGKDIKTFTADKRTNNIGFILQEPILFSGTIRENILYGNDEYRDYSEEALTKVIHNAGLESLLNRFEGGLEAKIATSNNAISLGQKQLIAFMRSVLRKPELLILDEATANIDTVTEQLLEEILGKLPRETTRIIIAHRLNTIQNADEIFFVNAGQVTRAGSMDHAMEMLSNDNRES